MKNNDAFYLTVPLVKSIEKDVDYSGNYLVYGQGGFGKTTSMLMLFRCFLSQAQNGENIVPIYIDSKGLDFTYDKPVFEYIIREYCGLNKDISQHIETLNDLLKNSDKKYYIIIDAINEAERNKFKIIFDIASLKEIFDKNHTGRLIVSSRTDENLSCFNDFKRLKMLDFKDEQIVEFLNKYDFKNDGKPIDKIDVERIDKNLLKILRVPMFLKVFRDVYKDADVFPDLYTKNIIHESDLLCKFVDKIIDDKIGMHKAEQSPEYIKAYFALNRFLPAIAFELAKNDEFTISESVLDDLFKNKFNESYFKQFQNRRENYFKYAGDLDDLLNDCIDDFSFITYKGKNKKVEYSFSHQVWRDYFSAVYLATSMDYDVAGEFKYQISDNIQQYAGEIIKEYEFENKTDILSPMSPIEAFMQRNCNTLSPLAVRLCVDIMKKARNGNLTAKYNDLDLRYINFYDYNLQGSSFNNSKVYEHNFVSQGHLQSINSVFCSPDGRRIVSGSNDQTIRIWDAETRKQIREPLTGHTGCVKSVSYSPDGKRIVSGSNDKTIRIWDAETGKQIGEPIVGHTDSVNSVSYSPDRNRIVSCSYDKTIRIWDAETGKQVGEPLKGHTNNVTSVCYSPDGKRIVSGSWDKAIRIWDVETGEQIREPLTGHTGWVKSVSYSPDGKRIVSGSNDKTIRIWNAETGEQIGEPLKGHTNDVTSVCYSPDSKKIMSVGADITVRIWSVKTGKQMGDSIEGNGITANSMSYSPDGKRIAIGFSNNKIRIRDAVTGLEIVKPLEEHKTPVGSVSFSPNGKRLVSCGFLEKVIVWDVETGKQIGQSLTKDFSSVCSAFYSPNGKKILGICFGGEVKIWNAETGKPIENQLTKETNDIGAISFSADGTRIVSGGNDKKIRIWDAELGELIGELFVGHTICSVSYSSDQKNIVNGNDNGTIQIWNVEMGKQIGETITGHTGSVKSVCYSHDGKRIISGSCDTTVRIWEVETGKQIGKLGGYTWSEFIIPGMGNPDFLCEKRIISLSRNGTMRIWDLETQLYTVLKGILPCNIQKCNFENAIFNVEDIIDLCHTLYYNGADVPKEYEPKPIPFEWNDEELNDKKSE